jgi:hypothetical protein
MRTKFKYSLFFVVMAFVTILSFLIGCGGGGSSPTSSGPTQDQATAIAQQIANAANYGMSHMSAELAGVQAPQNNPASCEVWSSELAPTQEKPISHDVIIVGESTQLPAVVCVNVPINISANSRTSCTAGGYITVVGSLTGTASSCNMSYLSLQLTESIVNWQCISGWVVNGNPYISLTGTFTFLAGGAPATQQTMTVSGGFAWTGTDAGSCQIYLTTNFNTSTGSSTTTGVVCGYPISVST